MADARRTKRVRESHEELSLEEHIQAKRRALVEARREVPSLLAKAASLREEAEQMRGRWQRRQALDCLRTAAELQREAEVRSSMRREHAYESTVVTYLRLYHEPVRERKPLEASRKRDAIEAYVQQSDLAGQRRASILDEYLVQMNQAPPKVCMVARDECPTCAVKLLHCVAKSVLACPQCGYAMTYLDATSSTTSFDDVVEYSHYSYKRANHFQMHIALCQGKEAHRVPAETLEMVMRELYRQRVLEPAEVTPKRVRAILRRLRLRRAYDHVCQITSRISGIPPPRISVATEERLRLMFLQMQPVFERHAPKTRTNFLSYSYVLYRCFQIMGLEKMLDGISLLKGREKLELNDAIFRKMCVSLGWPVFDLPPVASS